LANYWQNGLRFRKSAKLLRGDSHNLQKEIQLSNTTMLKWFLPYVLVASLQYQFTKDGLSYASPFVLMSFRYVIVGVTFYFLGGRRIPIDRDAVLVAIFASLSSISWAVGLATVSPGDSAVLSYTMPLFSIPLAFVMIREKVSGRELSGALIGFSGVLVYSVTLTHSSQFLGALYTILGAVFWGAYSVYYRKLRARQPMPILTTQFLIGSIPLLAGAVFYPKMTVTNNLVIDLVYIVIFTGLVQFYLWNGLLRRGRVGRITTLAFAVPVVTFLIDYLRNTATPTAFSILGASLMFAGIFISTWHKSGSSEEMKHSQGKETSVQSASESKDSRPKP
jgi:drug/metabolite transporter (DMT)-like permease